VVEEETLLVTSVSGNNLTATRGAEGSAVAHAAGVAVAHVLTAGGLRQFRADNVQTGTFASRPAAGNAGTLYLPTDSPIAFRDNGTSWVGFGPVLPLDTPPAANTFTIRQTGSNATLVDDKGGLLFTGTDRNVTDDGLFADLAIPGGAGSASVLTVGFHALLGGPSAFANYSICGIHLFETATNCSTHLVVYADNTGAFRLQHSFKTALVGTHTTVGGFDMGGYPIQTGPMLWLRVQDDGLVAGSTNRTWWYSPNGQHWVRVWTEGRAAGFTSAPNRAGVYLNTWSENSQMFVSSFKLT
jgi:hypothetical protein